MNAKSTDLARIQEIYDVVSETTRQIGALGITRARFLDPADDAEDLITEGILNRVLRALEEAGHVSDEVARLYGFDRPSILGVRNRLAHAYGEVDRSIVWSTIEKDFPDLLASCRRFCDDNGVDLA